MNLQTGKKMKVPSKRDPKCKFSLPFKEKIAKKMNLTCTIKSSINNRKELEVRNKALQYKKNKIQSKV